MSATNNPGWSQGGGSEGDTVWFLSCSAPEKDQVEGKWEAAYAFHLVCEWMGGSKDGHSAVMMTYDDLGGAT
jgi:hypothetical protein